MSACPECAQLLSPEAASCPACGHDLRVRRQPRPPLDRDEEQDNNELLAAAIADAASMPRQRPGIGSPAAGVPSATIAEEDVGDLVPARSRLRFWRRNR
ncbi:MAG TPA: hypothetical protein VM345_17515 [Acidimicrobiales bacterium]|jgi:hypothetical protein|nr:hypothetical protein [Acidimicrobiales bacterium]